MYKLPVFATIRETYRFIGGQLSALVNYAMVPVIFGTVIATLHHISFFGQMGRQFSYFGTEIDPDQIASLPNLTEIVPTSVLIALFIIIGLVNVAFYFLFAVAWHRRYLLGSEVTSPREIFAWRGRHWRFVGNGILVSLALMVVAAVTMFPLFAVITPLLESAIVDTGNLSALIVPALILNFVASIPMGLVACRLVLVFPSVAIERKGFGLSESMKLTRGNTWRIALVFLLGLYLPYTILVGGVVLLIISPFVLKLSISSISAGFIVMLLQQAFFYASIAVGVSTLSIIYKKLVDNVPLETAPAGPSTV